MVKYRNRKACKEYFYAGFYHFEISCLKSVGLSNTPAEGVKNIFYIFITQGGVKGESEFVFIHIISVGIIFDVKSQLFVCGEQRQRFEVYVADNAVLRHTLEECVAVFLALACKSHKVKMSAAAMIIGSVVKEGDR